MKHYVTLDGGTTNTRLRLITNGRVADSLPLEVGARNGREPLKTAVRQGVESLLNRNQRSAADITCILASGMITSEFGLIELPHLPAPAGIEELHRTMHRCTMETLSPIPFAFIRGVRTQGTTLAATDMMRGEETELMGILQEGEGLYVLPGSHSKLIRVDGEGRITDFSTMLTGEMLAALSSGTILKDAIELIDHPLQKDALLEGYRYADRRGINEALFKTRVLKNLFGGTPAECYSFFLGAVLQGEIAAILRQDLSHIILGGRSAIKEATALLLKECTAAAITVIPDAVAETASALGAVKIYEY